MKKLFVVFAACALVFAFTAPTMAADWDFYGSARMATFVDDSDVVRDNNDIYWLDENTQTTWSLQSNSRVGAKVKTNDNGIGGRFEYGTGVNLRLLYGTWNFNSGTLLVGQDYTPTTDFISNQVWGTDNDLIGLGMPYGGRQPQIKLSMFGFQIAFISPNTKVSTNAYIDQWGRIVLPETTSGLAKATDYGDVEVTYPKIEAAYNFKTDMFFVRPYIGYNTFTVNQYLDNRDRTIDSWLGGLTLGVTPGQFYFKGGAYIASNPGEYGLSNAPGGSLLPMGVNTRNLEYIDAESYGFQAILGYTMNDMFSFEAGWGMAYYEWDIDSTLLNQYKILGNPMEYTDMSYYVNATITLSPGFFIVPEVGYIDREDFTYWVSGPTGSFWDKDERNTFYAGIKWQINF